MIKCLFHKYSKEIHVPQEYKGNNFDHTQRALKLLKKYECPVNPDYEIPYDYDVSLIESYSNLVLNNKDEYFIFVPLNVHLLKLLIEAEPNYLQNLYRYNEKPNVHLIFDYNNESLLPGRFGPNSDQEWCSIIDYTQFYISSYGVDHTENFDPGFESKGIIGCLIYHVFWYLRTLGHNYGSFLKDPELIFTHKGKSGPIRYFVPCNQFRPSRGKLIVEMEKRGLLRDTEWNMNDFTDWNNKPQSEIQGILRAHTDLKKYFEWFGTKSRHMSYPWNRKFNYTKQDILNPTYFGVHKTPYTSFPIDLIQKIYIYIAAETFITEDPFNNEEPEILQDFSEKTCKGFVFGLPMFVYGFQGVAKACERRGFDMFRDYWTSDFDSQHNTDRRLIGLVDSAINFPDANQDIIDRCRHNKNKFVQKEFLWSTINQLFKEILDK